MTVHDESSYIVKEEYAEEAALLVKTAFEDTCKKFVVPVTSEVDIGDNYAQSK